MSYNKIEKCLPEALIREIQKYVDGETIYIPKKTCERKCWGSKSGILSELNYRNEKIYHDYLRGYSTRELAEIYFLSVKSIQRILLELKKENKPYE